MSLSITHLGTGSRGNSTLLESEDAKVLIDQGFSGAQLEKRLALLGISPQEIDCIVISHHHGDHGGGARIAQKKVQLKQTSQEIANKRAYARNLTKYEARIEKQKQRLEHARSLLPDNTYVAELLAQFGAKAEQTGLEIKSFKPGGVTKRKLFSEIQFEVQVVGSFHEIATFIESLSQIDQITTVGAFSMQPKSSNTEEHLNLNAQLQVTTFRFNRAG